MITEEQTAHLRQKVLDELALVQGRIALAAKLEPRAAKDQLRLAHSAQRASRLADAAEFLLSNEEALLRHFANGSDVEPSEIDPVIIPVRTPADADLFKFATLQWSVPVSSGYGRRSRFLVRDRYNGKLVAIFALGDPVIAQRARDTTIGWTKEQRNQRLYNVYDAYVLGAVEPYRQLLGGKLAALLTMSNDVRDFLAQKYTGNTTKIREKVKDPTPVLITTSSALGRSSVYNRVTYRGRKMFHSVGFTRGFGHFQFSEAVFADMLALVRDHTEEVAEKEHSSQYGSGPNWRFRVIRNALEILGIDEEYLQHNVKREVFLAPLGPDSYPYLCGETNSVELFNMPAQDIGTYFRERWAVGRAERKPAFRFWRREEGRLTHLLADRPRQLAFGSLGQPPPGRVDLGPYSLAVGVAKEKVHGKPLRGKRCDGLAYMSRLGGPDFELTIADIKWDSGLREVRGWLRHDSPPPYDELVGRLGIEVLPSGRFRGMSVMDARGAAIPARGGPVSARSASAVALSNALGLEVVVALDRAVEATVGTRADLLRDDGSQGKRLCVVFDSESPVAPALIWSFLRAVRLSVSRGGPAPAFPAVLRPAPRLSDLAIES